MTLNPISSVPSKVTDPDQIYNTKQLRRSAYTLIYSLQTSVQGVDIPTFIQNIHKDKHSSQASDKICKWVRNQTRIKQIGPDKVYKLLLNVVDKYDLEQRELFKHKNYAPKSSFALRNIILLASQKSNVFLHSWNVFTKNAQSQQKIWAFLDNFTNWVPEEQRVIGKWIETTFIKMQKLSKAYPEKNVILLKGGFGAGKTSLITEKLGEENASYVLAPDKAKDIVRRYFRDMPHSVAHMQGSAISYKLFDEMLTKIPGTLVYDSALSDPKDLKKYIAKAQAAGKKVIVYDVARLDVLRALAVLKRPIKGEDPRIPPEHIISSAIVSKLTRTDCMKLVLNHLPESVKTAPEYHFLSTDSQGSNREEVLVLTHNKIEIPEKAKNLVAERLGFENLKITENNQIVLTTTEEELTVQYRGLFNQSVRTFVDQLAVDDKPQYEEIFRARTLPLESLVTDRPLTTETLYSGLAPSFKKQISEANFKAALSGVSIEGQQAFMALCKERLKAKESITYLDLPLYTALAIHANLKEDPWQP